MNRETLKGTLRNLLLLAFAFLPAFFLVAWIQAILQGVEGSREPGYMLETGFFYYLTIVLPAVVGGVLQQGIMLTLPATLSQAQRRIVAVLSSVLVPAAVVASGFRFEVMMWFGVPALLAVVGYGVVQRLPVKTPAPAAG